jgi:hypothetical protein
MRPLLAPPGLILRRGHPLPAGSWKSSGARRVRHPEIGAGKPPPWRQLTVSRDGFGHLSRRAILARPLRGWMSRTCVDMPKIATGRALHYLAESRLRAQSPCRAVWFGCFAWAGVRTAAPTRLSAWVHATRRSLITVQAQSPRIGHASVRQRRFTPRPSTYLGSTIELSVDLIGH